jgi:hypothetical protein
MKVWLKYIGWYEDCSLDAVMTEEAMLNDKQSYYLEATVKLSEDIKYLTDKVEIAKKERLPYIEQHKEYCQRKHDLMESLNLLATLSENSLATLSDGRQKHFYILLKDVKAKLRKYTKEIERKSFYIKNLEQKIEKLKSQTEEEILNSYLVENHIIYESWEVLER